MARGLRFAARNASGPTRGRRALPMNANLLRSCVVLWVLGLLGMSFARAVLVLEPHASFFRVAAALWIVGGLGYTGLGLFALIGCERERTNARSPAAADLSALIRRR